MMKIILFSILFSSNVWAQKDVSSGRRKEIEEIMKMQNEMLQSLLDDSSFSQMEKRMEEMMKRFDNDSFFSQSFRFNNPVIGEYDWTETEKSRTLILKVKQIKDRPLDIKVENQQIKIKGEVEEQSEKGNKGHSKSISKIHFERVFSIPQDVDATKPNFENRDGELQITFPKTNVSSGKVPKSNKVTPTEPDTDTGRVPLDKQEGDISI